MIQWLDEALNKASDIRIKINRWLKAKIYPWVGVGFSVIVLGLLFGAIVFQGRRERARLQAEQAEAQVKKDNNPVVSVRSDSQSHPSSETYKPTDSYGMRRQYEDSFRKQREENEMERARERAEETRRQEQESRELQNRHYNRPDRGSGWSGGM